MVNFIVTSDNKSQTKSKSKDIKTIRKLQQKSVSNHSRRKIYTNRCCRKLWTDVSNTNSIVHPRPLNIFSNILLDMYNSTSNNSYRPASVDDIISKMDDLNMHEGLTKSIVHKMTILNMNECPIDTASSNISLPTMICDCNTESDMIDSVDTLGIADIIDIIDGIGRDGRSNNTIRFYPKSKQNIFLE